jgi:methionine salvage enolase-phosphatase E1
VAIIRRPKSRREARSGAKILEKSGIKETTTQMLLDNNDFLIAVNVGGQIVGVVDRRNSVRCYARKDCVFQEIMEQIAKI